MKGHKLLIHHLRHATFVVEVEEKVILVDPMLGHKGSIIPFAVLRHRARLNPTVELPSNAAAILDKVNHAVITHRHPDHLDRAGVRFLRERSIPVTCSYKDSNRLRKKGLNLQTEVKYWEKTPFLSGHITGIPARHGYGFIAGLMGNVMGFVIEMANSQPCISLPIRFTAMMYTRCLQAISRKYLFWRQARPNWILALPCSCTRRTY
jgi:L-ascorbate metabolism protein UlaG (beta-lactamase superfamily)